MVAVLVWHIVPQARHSRIVATCCQDNAENGRALRRTVFWMALTRWAKRRVLRVSAMLATAGLTLAIMIVFALPPKESCDAQDDILWRQQV